MSGSVWEIVYSQQYDVMERTRLDNGWIYRNRLVVGARAHNPADYSWLATSTYVPDAPAPLAQRRDERQPK